MSKGIIMSITDREAVLLTHDSNFVRVVLPDGQFDIGQEIVVKNTKNNSVGRWALSGGRKWGAIAAILIVAIMFPIAANIAIFDSSVYAYVTLDINPSTEFSINQHDKIIGAQPLNDQATIVLEGAKLKGRDIDYGIEYFITKACELGYSATNGEGAVIATAIMEEGENTGFEQKITETLNRAIEKNQLSVKAGVLSANKQIKEEADKAGVSTGKYLIALQASDDQLAVNMEDVKNSSIGDAISKAGGNLESVLKRAHKTNEELIKLFEKNRDKLKEKNDKDNGSNNGRGNNDGKDNGSNNGRGNNDNKDNGSNNGRGNNDNKDNGSNGKSNNDNKDNGSNGRGNNDGKDNGNNGRENNDDKDNGSNNGRGNNDGKDNGSSNGRGNNDGKDNGSNNGRGNNDDKDNGSNNGRGKGKPGIIEDIIMQLFG